MCSQRPEEGIGPPGTVLTDGCELPAAAGTEPGPLQEPCVFLARKNFWVFLAVEPSLQFLYGYLPPSYLSPPQNLTV